MKQMSILGFLFMAACADPKAWEDECRLKYSDEVAVEMCVSNERAGYSQRMNNLSQAMSGLTLQGQPHGGFAPSQNIGLMRNLRAQWVQNGGRMCRYSDGTVMNIGVGVCPRSI